MASYKVQRKLFYFYVGYYYLSLCYNLQSSPKTIKRLQRKNLKRFIKKAYEIPFYRKRFKSVGLTPDDIVDVNDLKKLPILTKAEYREWMIEEDAKPENKECMRSKTSGSTGTPTLLLFTPREYAQDIAHALRTWKFCGYNPVFGKTMTRMQSSSEQVGYKTLLQKFGILRREMLDQSRPEKEVIKKINDYKPDLLQMCLPEFLKLAIYARKNGGGIYHPKYVYSLGEVIDAHAENIIYEAFGSGLMSNYGCAEMGEVSTRVPGNRNYRIHQDMYAAHIREDKEIGDIILTSLYRDKFPLINYDVGDIGKIEDIDGFEYFTEIRGRKNDCFYFENGTCITYYALDGIVVKMATDVMQMKFIQENYRRIKIIVVQDPKSAKSQMEIEKNVTDEMRKVCPNEVEFAYSWVEVIEPNSNGKIRMMESKVVV